RRRTPRASTRGRSRPVKASPTPLRSSAACRTATSCTPGCVVYSWRPTLTAVRADARAAAPAGWHASRSSSVIRYVLASANTQQSISNGVLAGSDAMQVADLSARRFAPEGLQKLNLFQTPRFFADVYCLEVGQEQKAHAHEGSDKVYCVLEGRAR